MRRLRVYVSGPITNGGTETNLATIARSIDAAILAGSALVAAGYAPLIPHLNYGVHTLDRFPWETWLEVDLAWIGAADAVLRLPGESRGADLEVTMAERLGIPVVTSIAALGALRPAGEA